MDNFDINLFFELSYDLGKTCYYLQSITSRFYLESERYFNDIEDAINKFEELIALSKKISSFCFEESALFKEIKKYKEILQECSYHIINDKNFYKDEGDLIV